MKRKISEYCICYSSVMLFILIGLYDTATNQTALSIVSLMKCFIIFYIMGLIITAIIGSKKVNINKKLSDLNMTLPTEVDYDIVLNKSDLLHVRCNDSKSEKIFFVSDAEGTLLYLMLQEYKRRKYKVTTPFGNEVAFLQSDGSGNYDVALVNGIDFKVINRYKPNLSISKENNISMRRDDMFNYFFFFGDELIGEAFPVNGNNKFNKIGEINLRILNKRYRLEIIVFALNFLNRGSSNASYSKIMYSTNK